MPFLVTRPIRHRCIHACAVRSIEAMARAPEPSPPRAPHAPPGKSPWGAKTGIIGRMPRLLIAFCLLSCSRQDPPHPASPAYPPAFLAFMMRDWQPTQAPLPQTLPAAAAHRARRRALSSALSGHALVIPSGALKTRNADQNYPFRPGSDFAYLTGNTEPGAVLLMLPEGGSHSEQLFVAPRRDHGDARFVTDRANGVLWVGQRYGVAETQARYGVAHAESLEALPEALRQLASSATPIDCLRNLDPQVDAVVPVNSNSAAAEHALQSAIATLRLRKDTDEIAEIQTACDITARGFADVLRALPQAHNERDLAVTFTARASGEGNDNGYAPVVAAGPHATVLHWSFGTDPLPSAGLLLLDMGAESTGLYSADITRTVPMTGVFTAPQKEVYEAVLRAQDAAFATIRPGAPYAAAHRAAMQSLTEYLVRRGILKSSVEDALDPNHRYSKRYTLHGFSHMLGLDVHDCGAAPESLLQDGPLQPGMVLTVEPGLYFQPDDLTVPAELRGMGVRIEDDVLVTEGGYRLLSNLPRKVPDIEAWMAATTGR